MGRAMKEDLGRRAGGKNLERGPWEEGWWEEPRKRTTGRGLVGRAMKEDLGRRAGGKSHERGPWEEV